MCLGFFMPKNENIMWDLTIICRNQAIGSLPYARTAMFSAEPSKVQMDDPPTDRSYPLGRRLLRQRPTLGNPVPKEIGFFVAQKATSQPQYHP